MRCTQCGGTVTTKVFTEIRPNHSRMWLWAIQCSHCGHLADAGLKPDAHSCKTFWNLSLRKSSYEN